ncbi:hypothetical protein CCMA1212_006363 [Trichoderma ghanense]|uniref:Uncharacterized protein n=1 Tax=Trichoderma ghanense TaxID=65468 RepID=A0ABY2H0X4_9HYPO
MCPKTPLIKTKPTMDTKFDLHVQSDRRVNRQLNLNHKLQATSPPGIAPSPHRIVGSARRACTYPKRQEHQPCPPRDSLINGGVPNQTSTLSCSYSS